MMNEHEDRLNEAREIVKTLVKRWRFISELDGDLYCIHCGAWIEAESHEEDCAYMGALAWLEREKNT